MSRSKQLTSGKARRVTCPSCDVEIPPDDVNVGEGVAYCRACGSLHRLAEILSEAEHSDADAGEMPAGCHFEDAGSQTVVRASTRSTDNLLRTIGMTAFWNFSISIFVFEAIAETLRYLGVPLPNWLPTVGSGMGMSKSLGTLLFLWLFLTPFMAIGVGMACYLCMALFGRVEVRVRDESGQVLIGFGPVVWLRRFDASRVESVRIVDTASGEEEPDPKIVIETVKKVRFGGGLRDDRRKWMLAVLRQLLSP